MTDETVTDEPKVAKVFSLRSRKEMTVEEFTQSAGEVVVEGDDGPEAVMLTSDGKYPPCQDTTEAVQTFMEQAKDGLLQGFVAIAWNQKHKTFDRVIILPKVKTEDTVLMMHAYLGAMRLLIDDLSSHIADVLGPENVNYEVGDDDDDGGRTA